MIKITVEGVEVYVKSGDTINILHSTMKSVVKEGMEVISRKGEYHFVPFRDKAETES